MEQENHGVALSYEVQVTICAVNAKNLCIYPHL